MNLGILFSNQNKRIQRWTTITKECFSINCICDNCSFIPKKYKCYCKVKNYVLMTYRKLGKP